MKKQLSAFLIAILWASPAHADNFSWGSSYQGSSPTASSIRTNSFDGICAGALNVQECLDLLDDTTGGGGSASSLTVTQTSHGFSVGDIIRSTSTANTYTKALADSDNNAEVVGIVTAVTDANTFTYTTHGIITTGVPTNTAGTVYFLSPTVAGAMTATSPSSPGQVSKPVLVVLQSATRALFNNYRGKVLGTEGGFSLGNGVSGGTANRVLYENASNEIAEDADLQFDGTTLLANTVDLNGGTIDGTTIGASSASSATFTSLNASGGGALTGTWSNLGTVTTMDLNGGTIDGTTIGASSASTATFTTLALTPASTAGQLVRSTGSGAALGFSTPTYPNSAAATGGMIRAGGTNFAVSSTTWPNAATSGRLVVATGTDAIGLSGADMTYTGSQFTVTSITGTNFTTTTSNATNSTVSGVMTIPSGTAPTIDAAGEIAEDTTITGQMIVGASGSVLTPIRQMSQTIESPADVDNFLIGKMPYGIVVQSINCIVDPADSSESVVIDIQERDGSGDSPASVDAAITCSNTGAADDGSLSNATIDSGDWMSIDIGTVTGTVTQVSYTIKYKVVRE